MQHYQRVILLIIAFILPSSFAFSQTTPRANSTSGSSKSGTTYVSALDQGLTLRKVIVLPFRDNVNSIYATPLTEKALETHKALHLWNVEKGNETFDPSNPATVKKYLQSQNAEGLLTGQVLKGPQSIQITLSMYSAMDGKVLYYARQSDLRGFNTGDVLAAFENLHNELMSQIPYRGLVVSRRGQEVTVNLGTENGLRSSQTLTVLQMIKLHRHPKLGFMVGAEKVILGRVRIFKADEFLSFGEIEFEKEPGAIQVNQKVLPDNFVAYNSGKIPDQTKALEQMRTRPDEAVALGESPKEWKQPAAPKVGAVRIQAGMLQYQQSVALVTAGTKSIDTTFGPTLTVGGELWFSEQWFMDAEMRQSIFSVDNPLPGTSPGTLDMNVAYYSLAGGYNIISGPNFFGPKFQTLVGISQFSSHATETNPTPVATNMTYGGLYLGLRGFIDISPENPWLLGAQFKYHLTRTFSESINSGSSNTPNITEFDFIVKRLGADRINYVGNLGFSFYDSNFTGPSNRASSVSHKNTLLTVGVEYLF